MTFRELTLAAMLTTYDNMTLAALICGLLHPEAKDCFGGGAARGNDADDGLLVVVRKLGMIGFD